MRKFIVVSFLFLIAWSASSQKYITENSEISFYSYAPIEDIDAVNTKTVSFIDSGNGKIVFSVPINQFQFKKSLMQEHFNEKYLESDKYPKATFQGKILNFEFKDGRRNATAEGNLTIHGVTKKVTIDGSYEIKEDKIFINAEFKVKLEDYKISIPRLLFQNIAEIIDVKVKLEYKKYEQ